MNVMRLWEYLYGNGAISNDDIIIIIIIIIISIISIISIIIINVSCHVNCKFATL